MSTPTEPGWYWYSADKLSISRAVRLVRSYPTESSPLLVEETGAEDAFPLAEYYGTFIGPLIPGLLTEAQRAQAWRQAKKHIATQLGTAYEIDAWYPTRHLVASYVESLFMPSDFLKLG